jgi:cell division protein FtsX
MIVLWFLIKEGFRGLWRSNYAGAFSIIIIALSLILVGFGYVAARDTLVMVENIRSQFDITVFVERSASVDELENFVKQLGEIKEIENIVYISVDSAAAQFRNEFGEDIFSILDYNPLPPSFTLNLKRSHAIWPVSMKSRLALNVWQSLMKFATPEFPATARKIPTPDFDLSCRSICYPDPRLDHSDLKFY